MDQLFSPALLLNTSEARLPLQMLIVFASATLLAEISERLRMPGLVGMIVAGVIIGPSGLGWIHPNELLEAMAELGVMFLLFNVGLEVRSSELLHVGRTALLVAALGVIIPFFMGYTLLLLWGEPQLEAVFVGAALVATSVGITARVLASKGLMSLRASRIILAAAVIDDVLGLLVLAFVSSMARGNVNLLELALSAALSVGFTVAVVLLGSRTMQKIVPKVNRSLAGEPQFVLAMLLLFALSVIAVWAGVAAIIGAFLAGVALSESVSHRVHDLSRGVTELLVPFFLAGIGFQFQLGTFRDPDLMLLAGLVILAALVSKFIGCGLGALSMGVKDAIRVGVGMVPRGEVGIVIAQIGLSFGVIPPGIYGVVVLMSLATTVAAPPLLKIAFRGAQPDPGNGNGFDNGVALPNGKRDPEMSH